MPRRGLESRGELLGVSLQLEVEWLRVRDLEAGNAYGRQAERHATLIADERTRDAAERSIEELQAQL